ncbi:NAD(P)H-dependent oxidoreductase [Streptomyces sp. NBC_00237]|uniref:NADPH-dependent FMN reductase n=1 Tax=Streptomyces sp. NBC_00237 TaxID=2975687 RepID=UPI00224FB3AB|nr:NAD(P)H-dependent oxidoreductase [Streptomyces sp. NBC_00237]MCX5206814.1 NAD(P)H-dependent oxidoreductase [Streptomyces sp. NBC_00237]
MSQPRLHVVTASTRPGRTGPAVASWFTEIAEKAGTFDVRPVDLLDFALPLLDEPHHPSERNYTQPHTREWSASVDAADAFVFVTPEYNYGINAALKNALDYLYFEWQYKPVAFVSYGNTSGGLRAVQMTKQVVTTLKMFPVTAAVSVHGVDSYLTDGRFDGTEAMGRSADGVLTELHRLTVAMRPLRAEAR